MVTVTFRYKDKYSHGKWNTQKGTAETVEDVKNFYGLGIDPDCEFEIVSIEEINKKTMSLS